MADQTPDDVQLIIPEETQAKYPELVEGIKGSKSMDNKERNYWLQVLPVMTEEQVNELRDILSTEKRKLAEIEQKYASKGGGAGGQAAAKKPEKTEEELKIEQEQKKRERDERKEKEALARKEENVDDILSMLDDL